MIGRKTTLEQMAALVCQSLKNAGIDCFLSGGAVVSIYTRNKYESYDLDFVSFGDRKKIGTVMAHLGFLRDTSRLFRHPKSPYMVEFPGTSVQIGDEPVRKFAERIVKGNILKLLTPTDCVKDRLAAYIHWNDRQGLIQAAMVADEHSCKLEEIENFCRKEGGQKAFEAFLRQLKETPTTAKSHARAQTKPVTIHPWRLCPPGEHWVRKHPLTVPPSKQDPDGSATIRRGHCAKNPTGKDQLYKDEILEIGENCFKRLTNLPCPIDLKFKNGNTFDHLISGWVQYWNDVLKPSDPLTPDLVKALIASESAFRAAQLADAKRPNSARGLMQITNASRKILADERGEIKDHYVTVTRADLNDPSVNICAGIRWLFHKKALIERKRRSDATWHEAIYEYKGASSARKKRAAELMRRFDSYLQRLKECKK